MLECIDFFNILLCIRLLEEFFSLQAVSVPCHSFQLTQTQPILSWPTLPCQLLTPMLLTLLYLTQAWLLTQTLLTQLLLLPFKLLIQIQPTLLLDLIVPSLLELSHVP